MAKLPLAIDIADTVNDATQSQRRIDIESTAGRLEADHPDAGVTSREIAETLP